MLGGKERLEPFLVQTEEADVYSGRKVDYCPHFEHQMQMRGWIMYGITQAKQIVNTL